MTVREENFLRVANPHAWLRSAEDLHEQAVRVRRGHGRSITTEVTAQGEVVHVLDGADRATFLLCGFALENILKGLAIHHDGSLVGDGRLGKPLVSHDLDRLVLRCDLTRVPDGARDMLKLFSEAIVSWARYPCSLSADRTDTPDRMTEALWDEYCAAFSFFREELQCKLERGWHGPRGFYGHFTFDKCQNE